MNIERDIFLKIQPWLGEKKILIIKGARQVGKTTLLKYIQDYLQKKSASTIYLSADQDRFNPIYGDANLFVRYIKDQFGDAYGKSFCYVFIDEFQYCNEAGLFLKNIYDKEKDNLQLIVTGSSSLEISKNAEFLTGRKIEFRMKPLNFREYIGAKSDKKINIKWNFDDDISDINDFYQIYKTDLEYWFKEYLNWGGYPEPSLMLDGNKREMILAEIVDTYVKKDIADFLKIENISGFNKLTFILSSQVGNLINKAELGRTIGLDAKTLVKYLDVLAGTFVFNFLKPYFVNDRKSITKKEKVYIEDFGFAKTISNRGVFEEYDLLPGALVENFVYTELSGKINNPDSLFYYQNLSGSEIDFIIKDKNKILAIESKFQNNTNKQPIVMKNFATDFAVSRNIVLTKNNLLKKENCWFIPVVLLPFVEL